jgi:hypothetical protein
VSESEGENEEEREEIPYYNKERHGKAKSV